MPDVFESERYRVEIQFKQEPTRDNEVELIRAHLRDLMETLASHAITEEGEDR